MADEGDATPDPTTVLDGIPPLLPVKRPPEAVEKPRSGVSVGGVLVGVGCAAVEIAAAAASAAYSSSVHVVGATVGTATSLATRAVGVVATAGTRAVAGDAAANTVSIASQAVGATAHTAVASSVATTGAVVGAVATVGTSILARHAMSAIHLGGRAVGAVKAPEPPQSGGFKSPVGAEDLTMIERGDWVVIDTQDVLSLPLDVVALRRDALTIQTNTAVVDVSATAALPTFPPQPPAAPPGAAVSVDDLPHPPSEPPSAPELPAAPSAPPAGTVAFPVPPLSSRHAGASLV